MDAAFTIRLKKNEERRVLLGHPWIYSNEIDGKLRNLEAGSLVDVESTRGDFVGRGHLNPHSLITVRILSRERCAIDTEFFVGRLRAALQLRERVLPGRTMRREVHGESDGLPGIVVDRFGDVLCAQVRSAGMEAARAQWIDALDEVYAPRAIVLSLRGGGREAEGLEEHESVEVAKGEVPDVLWVGQEGFTWPVPIRGGQKTGVFLDQEENRRRVGALSKGCEVLDAFSYLGGFAFHALAAGAARATLVDASAPALELAAETAARNNLKDRVELVRADAFDTLADFAKSHRRFGVVSTDPPALGKSKKHLPQATKAYEKIATLALSIVEEGGLYAASSCSFHLSRDDLRTVLARAIPRARRGAVLLEMRGAAPDHPVCVPLPESDYLKCALLGIRNTTF